MMSLFRDRLKMRGARGIVGLQRIFKDMDDDGSNCPNLSEFQKACRNFKIGISDEYLPTLFNAFDLNNDKTLSIHEFLMAVRGNMSRNRANVVQQAWQVISNGAPIDMYEIKDKFHADKHPDVTSGKRTADQVLVEFLETFEHSLNVMERNTQDGRITFEEFMEYYSNVSFVIEDDQHFSLIIKNVWDTNGGQDPYRNYD